MNKDIKVACENCRFWNRRFNDKCSDVVMCRCDADHWLNNIADDTLDSADVFLIDCANGMGGLGVMTGKDFGCVHFKVKKKKKEVKDEESNSE